jgi:hypothetical protein
LTTVAADAAPAPASNMPAAAAMDAIRLPLGTALLKLKVMIFLPGAYPHNFSPMRINSTELWHIVNPMPLFLSNALDMTTEFPTIYFVTR